MGVLGNFWVVNGFLRPESLGTLAGIYGQNFIFNTVLFFINRMINLGTLINKGTLGVAVPLQP